MICLSKRKVGGEVGFKKGGYMGKVVDRDFEEVLRLIQSSKESIYRKINSELINLYWQVGEYISQKTQDDNWGKKTV